MHNWSYRWCKYRGEGEEVFLHEVTYDESGYVLDVSPQPITLIADSDSIVDITKILKMIERDSLLPVLEIDHPVDGQDFGDMDEHGRSLGNGYE